LKTQIAGKTPQTHLAPREAPHGAAARAELGEMRIAEVGASATLIARLATRPGDANSSHVALIGHLQRTHGNHAVQDVIARALAEIQRKIVTVGTEKVEVSDTKEAAETEEAKTIIATLKTTYGVDISSSTVVDAIKEQYANVPKTVTDALTTRQWRMIELRALADALKSYAPILGAARANSTRKDAAQELTSVGKVSQAIDTNTPAGELDTTTLGEYFKGKKSFGLFKSSEGATPDFADEKDQLVGTFVHEMGHGLLAYAYDDFVKATDGFWTDQDTKSGKSGAEAPITDYGAKNAREDLCETAMMYFVKPDVLKAGQGATKGTPKNPAPLRFAFMENIGKGWLPPVKAAPQVLPSTAPSPTTPAPTPVPAATH
jgi:hypothetical protein